MIGQRLSHYRIEERLGAGGMGEIYRASDEKLSRYVALKLLPSASLADDEARRRLRREAAVLSRLSHPHIATLHDFDTEQGIDFLVMELVIGPTLEEELSRGPLSEGDVIRLGSQLARGLVAAHEQGVIHRDLKPSNLKLTPDGLLKILDFGVAHLERRTTSAPGGATATETAAGAVLGSPPYMAPEQLLGKAIDARTDLYAAGACLYEMATGNRPHREKRGPQLTEAILHEAPAPPHGKDGPISRGLEAVILKALDKNPALRYQTARELLVDLERLQQRTVAAPAGDLVETAGVAAKSGRTGRWLVAGGLGVLVLSGAAWLLRPPAPPRVTNIRPLRLDLRWPSDSGFGATWTTDGVRLYFVGKRQEEYRLFQVPVTGGEPSEIDIPVLLRRGLEVYGFLPTPSALLCLAPPDLPSQSRATPVWTVPVPRGTPHRLGDLLANTASASPDGEQIALMQYDERRLYLARADGSDARLLVRVPPRPTSVTWAPNGRLLRFSASGPSGHEMESWVWETTVAGDAPRPLWPGQGGHWTGDGLYFVFERWNESARRFDVYAIRERPWPPWARPQPLPLTTGPVDFIQVGPRPDGLGLFAIGADARGELLRYDAARRRFTSHLEGASIASVDASRDGAWLAWTTWPEGVLWRSRADGSQKLQLTPTGRWAGLPRWSPDGKWIAFTGQPTPGAANSVSRVSAGGSPIEVLANPEPGLSLWDVCWLPDGQSLVFSYVQAVRPGLFRVDLGTRQVSPWPGAERLQYPKCSPEGRVFAVERPASDSALAGRLVTTGVRVFMPERGTWEEVSLAGSTYANWTRDGQSLIGLNANEARIERFRMSTRRSEVIAEVRGLTLAQWGGVAWMGLDATDAPLVTRDVTTRDLYALDWEAP